MCWNNLVKFNRQWRTWKWHKLRKSTLVATPNSCQNPTHRIRPTPTTPPEYLRIDQKYHHSIPHRRLNPPVPLKIQSRDLILWYHTSSSNLHQSKPRSPSQSIQHSFSLSYSPRSCRRHRASRRRLVLYPDVSIFVVFPVTGVQITWERAPDHPRITWSTHQIGQWRVFRHYESLRLCVGVKLSCSLEYSISIMFAGLELRFVGGWRYGLIVGSAVVFKDE